MHTLILSGLETETEPIKTAEEVLQEIDDMMMEDTLSDISPINEMFEKGRDILRCPLRNESIRNFFYFKCHELLVYKFNFKLMVELFNETIQFIT